MFSSPRKQSRPEPAKSDEPKPAVKAKTYSKKGVARVKRPARGGSGLFEAVRGHRDARINRERVNQPGDSILVNGPDRAQTLEYDAEQTEEDDQVAASPTPRSSKRKATPAATAAAANPDTEPEDPEMDEVDDSETCSFKRFQNHRWVGNSLEVKVQWDKGAPTWEPERNLHRDAPQALFAYWKREGGRPPNPKDAELYDVYAIRKHSKNRKKVLVEWVGYDKQDMTWVDRSVVSQTAQSVVDDYFKGLKKTRRRAAA
ncbi:hypothetical protein G7046_g2332 [Stylonectria norvegica]|nr:hypothetical protein G7046_g2332 [Stylonectria norvegica]